MLSYCKADLDHAYKNKRINKEGYQLINMIYERISAYKKDVDSVLEKLKSLDAQKYSEVKTLKHELDQTRTHYNLV